MLEKQLSEAWLQEGLELPIHNAGYSDSLWLQGPSPEEQAGRAPLLPEYFYFPLFCSWMGQSEGRPAGTVPLWENWLACGVNQNTSGSAQPPSWLHPSPVREHLHTPETQVPGVPIAQAASSWQAAPTRP